MVGSLGLSTETWPLLIVTWAGEMLLLFKDLLNVDLVHFLTGDTKGVLISLTEVVSVVIDCVGTSEAF